MDIVKLTSRPRTGRGKSYTRKCRMQGWVPAVYYGHNQQTETVEVNARELAGLIRNKKISHLIDLGLPGKTDSVAVVKELQRDVLNDTRFIHVDFQHVSMNEKVTVSCHIEVQGLPIGVKEDGGILQHPVRSLMVECLPLDIPEKIAIDVSGLKVGDSIHVRDIQIPKVEIQDSPDLVVAVVVQPAREEVAAGAPEAAAAGAEAGAKPAEAAKSEAKPKGGKAG